MRVPREAYKQERIYQLERYHDLSNSIAEPPLCCNVLSDAYSQALADLVVKEEEDKQSKAAATLPL